MSGRRAFALLLVSLSALQAAACSGAGEESSSTSAKAPESVLAVAIPARPVADPLDARDPASRVVLRQVFEPLSATVQPPYARAGDRPGLALGLRPTRRGTVWVVRLRRGVEFSDGTSLNAGVVALNARRWAGEPTRGLRSLEAADAPRSDRVRLIFSEPVEDLAARLADPRLGVVAPAALRARSSGRFGFRAAQAAGTGPFIVAQSRPDGIELVRNPGWWGSPVGLGPAVRLVDFLIQPVADDRARSLQDDRVQMAVGLDELTREIRAELESDPLLTTVETDAGPTGLERSVRGVPSPVPGREPAVLLSSAWLTSVGRTAQVP